MTISETNIADLAYGSPFPPLFRVGDVLVGIVPDHVALLVTGMDVKETENDRARYFGSVNTEDFTGRLSDFRKLGDGVYRPK